jgi:ADP-ribose pyrophosphatase YjhB (NUDIX family)
MDKQRPLNIAIGAVIHDNHILLIKRVKPPYTGLWGIPGGKVEFNEHVKDTAIREIFEETGINTEFKRYCGTCSEIITENNEIHVHFVIHVVALTPVDLEIAEQQEGEVAWFNLDSLKDTKDQIIPSDLHLIEKLVRESAQHYFDCLVEKTGDQYNLIYFR